MPRELAIGNDHVLFGFDQRYQLSELHFPRFDPNDSLPQHPGRFGLADDRRLFWTADSSWRVRLQYVKETAGSSASLANSSLQVVCHAADAADVDRPILVRQIHVRNLVDYPRTLRVLHEVVFQADDGNVAATQVNDRFKGLIQRVGGRCLFVGFWRDGAAADVSTATGAGVSRFLSGFDVNGDEPTDLPTGVVKIDVELGGFDECEVYLVMALAGSDDELTANLEHVATERPEAILARSRAYWRLWVTGTNINFGNLPVRVVDLFKRSLVTIRTCMHESTLACGRAGRGEILPAGLLAHAFDLAGLVEPARWFYRLCRRSLAATDPPDCHPAGLGVVVWSLWRHFFRYRDLESIRRLWDGLIRPAADGLCELYDDHVGLFRADRDLWGRGAGVDAFTLGAVYGGLTSARHFAICLADRERATHYGQVAERIKLGAERKLFDERSGRFGSVLWFDDKGGYRLDDVFDSAVFGLVKFGMFSPTDERIAATVQATCERLWVNTPVGGLARFDGDHQDLASPDLAVGIAGCPSTVSTVWLAQYLIARADTVKALREALPLLQWVVTHAGAAGLMPSTLDPEGGDHRRGAGDLWAHAEFVIAVVNYLEKLEHLQVCTACGQSIYRMRRHWPMQVRVQDLLDKYEPPGSETSQADDLVVFEHGREEVTLAVDPKECLGCGMCRIHCSAGVIVMADDKAGIDVNRLAECTTCRECQTCCPVKAIRLSRQPMAPACGR